jgi:hypothetical protein
MKHAPPPMLVKRLLSLTMVNPVAFIVLLVYICSALLLLPQRGKMGITCTFSASNLAEHCKTSWVLVTLQRLPHTTPHICTPHIRLHIAPTCFKKGHLQEAHPPHIHYQDGRRQQCTPGPLHQRKSHPSRCFHQSTQPM